MARNKCVPQKAITKEGNNKVPASATTLKVESYDDMNVVISFRKVDHGKWTLSCWKGKELTDLIKCFQKIEEMTWKQVYKHDGLNYGVIEGLPKITHFKLSPDVSICEMRVCKVKRIFGYRDRNVFYIIWFDRDHSICPQNKNRKYGG